MCEHRHCWHDAEEGEQLDGVLSCELLIVAGDWRFQLTVLNFSTVCKPYAFRRTNTWVIIESSPEPMLCNVILSQVVGAVSTNHNSQGIMRHMNHRCNLLHTAVSQLHETVTPYHKA